jgi:hypothetical protein
MNTKIFFMVTITRDFPAILIGRNHTPGLSPEQAEDIRFNNSTVQRFNYQKTVYNMAKIIITA